MTKKLLATAILCAVTAGAQAEFTTVARAYEVPLNLFTAPASINSTTIFRECETCEPRNLRVTTVTDYRVNGQSVNLEDFRKSLFLVRNRAAETVIVLHHLDSDTVQQIQVTL